MIVDHRANINSQTEIRFAHYNQERDLLVGLYMWSVQDTRNEPFKSRYPYKNKIFGLNH